MLNNEVVGFLPSQATKIHGSKETNPYYLEVVDHALRKFLTPEEFKYVTTGFRRSPWSSDALNRDLEKLNSPEHDVVKDEHYWKAIRKVHNLYKPDRTLYPVHFADLRHYPWELSTNVGAPFNSSKAWQTYVKHKNNPDFKVPDVYKEKFTDFRHRRDLFEEAHPGIHLDTVDDRMTKHNLYTEVFMINRTHIHDIKNGKTKTPQGHDFRYWNTAFARQHLVKADEDDKVRLVFGAPWLLLMAECMFIWPFMVSLLSKGERSPMLWGYETLLGGWSRLYAWVTRVIALGCVVMLDWSGFDRYARHTVIRDIHAHVIRPYFDFSRYWPTHDYPDAPADPARIQNLWNWMTDAILTTPLLLEDGTLIRFRHSGIYSGYLQTQILDSIYNQVMIFTCLSSLGINIDEIQMKVQGDDSIMFLPYHFLTIVAMSFLTMLADKAKKYFGAVLSVDKSNVLPSLEGAEVLKYKNTNGYPYRDELQLLAMLRNPERRSDLGSLKARCIGIAYADCGRHPRVYQICEDIYKFLSEDESIKINPLGLPGGIRYRKRYVPGEWNIDLSHFPTWFETVRHLNDPVRCLVDERHWPRKHFIGTP